MYNEIQSLYYWCKEKNIPCTMEPLLDGFQIRFLDGADVVQHRISYGAKNGCVEPAGIDEKVNYSAIPLTEIKEILLKKYCKTS